MKIIAISVLDVTPLKSVMILNGAGDDDLLLQAINRVLENIYKDGYYRISDDKNIFVKRKGNLIFGIHIDGKKCDKNECHAILDRIARSHEERGFLDRVLAKPDDFTEPLTVKEKSKPHNPSPAQYGSSPIKTQPSPSLLASPVRFHKPIKSEKTWWQRLTECMNSESSPTDKKPAAAMSLLSKSSP